MMRSKLFRAALCNWIAVSACCALPAFLHADPPTRADIKNLPDEEKAALLQKKERFDALSAEERDRMRALNTAITSTNHAAALHTTLDRYHEWLKTLTTKQRSDLLELPADERIDRIKELMQEQERARLRDLGGKQLPEEDVDAIFSWLEEFMKTHEDKYLERLPDDYRKKLIAQDDESRRRSLMRGIIMRGPRNDSPMPVREDLVRLLPKLSPATRAALESAKTPEEQQQVARQWIFSAMISKVLPPASEEDLQKIFKELPPDQRERLERKTPEEFKRELTWRYHWKQWPGREGGWRGPGQGFGPGFRPGTGTGPGPGPGGPNGPGGPGNGGHGGGGRGQSQGNERGSGERGPGGERPSKRSESGNNERPAPNPAPNSEQKPPPEKSETKE